MCPTPPGGDGESWFHRWPDRPLTLHGVVHRDFDRAVLTGFVASDGSCGSPRVAAEMHGNGWPVSTSTVAASMGHHGKQHVILRGGAQNKLT